MAGKNYIVISTPGVRGLPGIPGSSSGGSLFGFGSRQSGDITLPADELYTDINLTLAGAVTLTIADLPADTPVFSFELHVQGYGFDITQPGNAYPPDSGLPVSSEGTNTYKYSTLDNGETWTVTVVSTGVPLPETMPPAVPTDLSVDSQIPNGIHFSFVPGVGTVTSALYRSENESGDDAVLVQDGIDGGSFDFISPGDTDTYAFYVVSTNAAGDSERSNIVVGGAGSGAVVFAGEFSTGTGVVNLSLTNGDKTLNADVTVNNAAGDNFSGFSAPTSRTVSMNPQTGMLYMEFVVSATLAAALASSTTQHSIELTPDDDNELTRIALNWDRTPGLLKSIRVYWTDLDGNPHSNLLSPTATPDGVPFVVSFLLDRENAHVFMALNGLWFNDTTRAFDQPWETASPLLADNSIYKAAASCSYYRSNGGNGHVIGTIDLRVADDDGFQYKPDGAEQWING